MRLSDADYCSAACADALVEGLALYDLQAAHDVSNTAQEFWVAVQAAIRLKEVCEKPKPEPKPMTNPGDKDYEV